MSRPTARRPVGFTLIELLVVISIIALLISILLPALGAARASARSMQCLSNLRQVMIGVYAYTNDYHGSFPNGLAVTASNANWSLLISGYIQTEDVSYDDTSEANPVFLCPDARIEGGYCHYMVSHGLCSNAAEPAPWGRPLTLASQIHLSQVYMVADTAQNPTTGNTNSTGHRVQGWRASDTSVYRYFVPGVDDIDTTPTFSPNEDALTSLGDFRFRHAGETVSNIGFLDGHAGSYKQQDLVRRNLLPDAP